MRLLALCLGLLAIFGASSLLLGYLILRNQAEQQAQQEQYRRFEIIEATQRAVTLYRHNGGELNKALLGKDAAQAQQARAAMQQSRHQADVELARLRGFDPASAQLITGALDLVPGYSQQVMDALAAGRPADPQVLAALQRELNQVEASTRRCWRRPRPMPPRKLAPSRSSRRPANAPPGRSATRR